MFKPPFVFRFDLLQGKLQTSGGLFIVPHSGDDHACPRWSGAADQPEFRTGQWLYRDGDGGDHRIAQWDNGAADDAHNDSGNGAKCDDNRRGWSGAAAGSVMLTLTGTSGALIHTVKIPIAISPPPDDTLTLSPTSLPIMAGAAGSPVSVTTNAVNAFSGAVTVAITGLPAGVTANPATLSLTPEVAQSTTLTAALTAPATTLTITFTGTSGSLTHVASLALTVQAARMCGRLWIVASLNKTPRFTATDDDCRASPMQ